MSSINQRENNFKTYLINQNEPEEKDDKKEHADKPAATWMQGAYIPKRASFSTIGGRIKRYFA